MNKTTNDRRFPSGLTELIWWLSTLVFLVTEAIVVVKIFKARNHGSLVDYVSCYGAPLVVSIPWVLGMRGYSAAMTQLSSLNGRDVAMTQIARQFLYAEIGAYMMLSFFWTAFGG